jgi:Holliday junction resolvase
MALKRESKLWKRIKNLNLNAHIFRVESNTINGIPDVHCVMKGKSFWLELKSNDLKNYGISKWQINWHIEYQKHGGRTFILASGVKQRGLKLLRVKEPGSVELVAKGEDNELTLRLMVSRCTFHVRRSTSR